LTQRRAARYTVEMDDIAVPSDALMIRKPEEHVRAGWAAAGRGIAAASDDTPVWPEFENEADGELDW
jgi:antitoxin MazE